MSGTYIAQDILDECHQALRAGRSLETLAGRLHCDSEYLGRLLQMPVTTQANSTQQDNYLWSVDRLDAVL